MFGRNITFLYGGEQGLDKGEGPLPFYLIKLRVLGPPERPNTTKTLLLGTGTVFVPVGLFKDPWKTRLPLSSVAPYGESRVTKHG